MSASHVRAPAPSPILALVCLAVVSRLRPAWLATTLRDAAREQGVSPERLSRLASRALEPFEQAVARLTRRGRPRAERDHDGLAAEVSILRALLGVAGDLLAFVPRRRADVRALFVGAWLRLHEAHPSLTRRRFCETLGVSERTLRHWLHTAPPTPKPPAPPIAGAAPPPRPMRPPRRPRFGFDVVLPDTQHAADTTDLCAFGLPLKLLAVQDVGGRDHDLFDAVLVDDTESAGRVVDVFTRACATLPGAQMLTDQGTPYMAERTREALRELELEHAPQKEGDPRGKATIERAFETAKSIVGPVLRLTDRIAAAVPALASPDLAQASTTLLLTLVLRAYQAGARATRRALDARGDIEPDTLARLAAEQRQQVRADDRSSRLTLERIHGAYDIPGATRTFVDRFRRYGAKTLLEAEKRFATQVHRDDIKNRASYFAAILRTVADERARERRRDEHEARSRLRIERSFAEVESERAHHHAHPLEHLQAALVALADEWLPDTRRLLLRGRGVGRLWAQKALERLVELHGAASATDLARTAVRDFEGLHLDRLGPDGVRAVVDTVQPLIDDIPTPTRELNCAAAFASAMLDSTGPPARPATHQPLRT